MTQIFSICVIYSCKCISTYLISPRSCYQTKDLNLGLPPRISTSWHLSNGHYSWNLTKIHSLGISTTISPSWYLTKSLLLLLSHQEYPDLGISPRSSTLPLTKVPCSWHLTKSLLILTSHQRSSRWSLTK
jgi:hypothetical protein